MNSLNIHHMARNEVHDVVQRYEASQNGLGLEFEDEVRLAFKRISENPSAGAISDEPPYRFIKVDRFPYVVIYEIRDSKIGIVAVAHTSRDPGYWKHRRVK